MDGASPASRPRGVVWAEPLRDSLTLGAARQSRTGCESSSLSYPVLRGGHRSRPRRVSGHLVPHRHAQCPQNPHGVAGADHRPAQQRRCVTGRIGLPNIQLDDERRAPCCARPGLDHVLVTLRKHDASSRVIVSAEPDDGEDGHPRVGEIFRGNGVASRVEAVDSSCLRRTPSRCVREPSDEAVAVAALQRSDRERFPATRTALP
jgi:hypothetical protein